MTRYCECTHSLPYASDATRCFKCGCTITPTLATPTPTIGEFITAIIPNEGDRVVVGGYVVENRGSHPVRRRA